MSELYEKIYSMIRKIPRGKVATYGQIAGLAGLGPHARLVGYALHALPPDKRVPWHRVVSASGKIQPSRRRNDRSTQVVGSRGCGIYGRRKNSAIPVWVGKKRKVIVLPTLIPPFFQIGWEKDGMGG